MDCDCDSKQFFPPEDMEKKILDEQKQVMKQMARELVNILATRMTDLKKSDELKDAIEKRIQSKFDFKDKKK